MSLSPLFLAQKWHVASLWARARRILPKEAYICSSSQARRKPYSRQILYQRSLLLSSIVRRLRLKLIQSREYLFTHKRKRTFRAVFKRIVRAPSTDALDEFYYECEVDAALSENPWADTQDGTRRTILLRPSLITMIQDAPPAIPLARRSMPLGQGKTLRLSEQNWMRECIHNIRSVFRHLRRI
jgi:hypothetical protein